MPRSDASRYGKEGLTPTCVKRSTLDLSRERRWLGLVEGESVAAFCLAEKNEYRTSDSDRSRIGGLEDFLITLSLIVSRYNILSPPLLSEWSSAAVRGVNEPSRQA